MFLLVAGRPVLPRLDRAAQRRRTRSRCQRRIVSGVTSSRIPWRRAFGITLSRVASRARSAQFRFGRRACRCCRTASWGRRIKISAVFHVSLRRHSRSHTAARVIRRKTNRRPMIDDHQGPSAGRANLLARAMDGILGTHRQLLPGRRRCAMRAPRLTSRCPGFRYSGQPHPHAGSGGGPSGPSRSRQTSPDPHPSAAGKRQVRSGGPVLAWRSGCSDMSPAWRAGSALRRTGPCRNG